ncbi:MAG: F0F1 ATP synthase subunit epsilon [Chloroflexi bacterium]|nr:F0F1 ATP synthase subunit epsilon [Chloroflexota bacterium]MBU1748311.1 F0F1 ATP synthase subunit epsilon [Chloroflexota bacterium]
MATIHVDIVTAERTVFSDEVEMITAPGIDGELGILPRHAPLLTALQVGVLRLKRGGEETLMAIGGGFMDVTPTKVVILADSAERADEIDETRAEEARRRAERLMSQKLSEIDFARAESALRRSLIRLKVADQHRGRRRSRPPSERG